LIAPLCVVATQVRASLTNLDDIGVEGGVSGVSDGPRGTGGGGEGKYEVRQRTVTTGRRLRVYALYARSRLGGNTRRWSGGSPNIFALCSPASARTRQSCDACTPMLAFPAFLLKRSFNCSLHLSEQLDVKLESSKITVFIGYDQRSAFISSAPSPQSPFLEFD